MLLLRVHYRLESFGIVFRISQILFLYITQAALCELLQTAIV